MRNSHMPASRAPQAGRVRVAIVAFLTCLGGCATIPSESVYSPAYAVIDRAVVGGPGRWDFVTFEPSRQRLFISRGDRVQVWSSRSHTVIGEISGTAGVHGIAPAEELNRGFTSNGQAGTLSVFRLDDLRAVGVIPIPGLNPDAILYAPKFRRVYAFDGRSGDVTVVDAVSLKVLARIALAGKPEVAVEDDAGQLFVNIEDTSEVVMSTKRAI